MIVYGHKPNVHNPSDGHAGSLRVTVEAADWDIRAELANVPRAMQPDTAAETTATAAAAGQSVLPQQRQLLRSDSPSSPSNSPRGSPRKGLGMLAGQQISIATTVQQDGSGPIGPLQLLQQQQRQGSIASSNGSVSSSSGVLAGSTDHSNSSPRRGTGNAQPAGTAATTVVAAAAVPPSVASLDVVVKAFETRK